MNPSMSAANTAGIVVAKIKATKMNRIERMVEIPVYHKGSTHGKISQPLRESRQMEGLAEIPGPDFRIICG